MSPHRVLITLVATTALALSAGCAQDADPEADPDPPQTEGPETGASDPETEEPVESTPSVSLPSLPIGGSPELSSEDPSVQCASVSWIVNDGGAELQEGVAITITAVTPNPDYFAVADSGCGYLGDACLGYTFDSGTTSPCFVPVTLVAEVPEEHDDESLTAVGEATCTSQELCDEFALAVEGQAGQAAGLDSSLLSIDTDDAEDSESPTEG